MGSGLGMAGLRRQRRLRPPERLDPCLLVHRDDDSVVGRVDVEADDIADLQFELRVAGDLERLDPVGFQTVALQDAEHRRDRDPQLLRQRPQRPVTAVRRRRRHRKLDQFRDLLLRYRRTAPSVGDVVQQAVDTLLEEAVPPPPDRRLRQAEAVARVKDDGRPHDMLEDRIRIGPDLPRTRAVSRAQNDRRSLAPCHCGSAPLRKLRVFAGSHRIILHRKTGWRQAHLLAAGPSIGGGRPRAALAERGRPPPSHAILGYLGYPRIPRREKNPLVPEGVAQRNVHG